MRLRILTPRVTFLCAPCYISGPFARVGDVPDKTKFMIGRFKKKPCWSWLPALSDSFRIRPPSIPGMRPPSTQNPHICLASDPVVRRHCGWACLLDQRLALDLEPPSPRSPGMSRPLPRRTCRTRRANDPCGCLRAVCRRRCTVSQSSVY